MPLSSRLDEAVPDVLVEASLLSALSNKPLREDNLSFNLAFWLSINPGSFVLTPPAKAPAIAILRDCVYESATTSRALSTFTYAPSAIYAFTSR